MIFRKTLLFLVLIVLLILYMAGCATAPKADASPQANESEAATTPEATADPVETGSVAADQSSRAQQEYYDDAFYAAVEKEIEVGRTAFAKLSGKYGFVREEAPTLYLNKFFRSLAFYAERQELPYRIGILAAEQVNAYALPGGYVLITLGALRNVETPAELAGILAHELGHIDMRHILDNVKIEVRYSFFETLARVLAGSRQVISVSVDQINQKIEERLFVEGYASDDEFEADAYAVNLLQVLNIDSAGYSAYLRRLSESGSAALENLDATHPPLDARLNRLEERAAYSAPFLETTPEFNAFKNAIDTYEVSE